MAEAVVRRCERKMALEFKGLHVGNSRKNRNDES